MTSAILIPRTFLLDGDYAFAMSWWGGLHWKRKFPNHSDFFACSFVRIKGGLPLKNVHKATWSGPDKKCHTGSTRPLQCGGESCGIKCGLEKCPLNSTFYSVPDDFKNGAVPKIFLSNITPDVLGVTKPANATDILSDAAASKKEGRAATVITDQEIKKDTSTTKKSLAGPLKSILVFLDNKLVEELQDGEKATIAMNGKAISFEGWTGGKKVGTMRFKINGVFDKKIERFPPYAFKGNTGPKLNPWPKSEVILNKQFEFRIVLWSRGKKYTHKALLTLTK